MEITKQKTEKITFRQYFEGLSDEEKSDLKKYMLMFYTESHFYNCIRNEKYSKPFRHLIEVKTNLEFNWDEQI